MSRPGSQQEDPAGKPRTQEAASTEAGGDVHIGQYREVVEWRESALVGVGTVVVGLVMTVVPLWWFGLGDDLAVDRLELAVLIVVEGVGGTVNQGELAASLSAYGALDSNLFGFGPAVGTLVPAVVLLAGGYVLADYHIEAGATNRPVEAVVAGGSLAVWFTLTVVLSALGVSVTAEGSLSVHVSKLLVTGLLYAGVFASTGAAIRVRARLTSPRGLLAGVATAVVTVVTWGIAENPVAGRAAEGLSEVDGTVGYFDLLRGFTHTQGIRGNEILPAWFVLLAPLVAGVLLACAAGRRDPAIGAGEGARVGVAYGTLVTFIIVGHLVVLTGKVQQGGGPRECRVGELNELVAAAPRTILLAGVVYPVAFAAIGGAAGAVLYRLTRGR